MNPEIIDMMVANGQLSPETAAKFKAQFFGNVPTIPNATAGTSVPNTSEPSTSATVTPMGLVGMTNLPNTHAGAPPAKLDAAPSPMGIAGMSNAPIEMGDGKAPGFQPPIVMGGGQMAPVPKPGPLVASAGMNAPPSNIAANQTEDTVPTIGSAPPPEVPGFGVIGGTANAMMGRAPADAAGSVLGARPFGAPAEPTDPIDAMVKRGMVTQATADAFKASHGTNAKAKPTKEGLKNDVVFGSVRTPRNTALMATEQALVPAFADDPNAIANNATRMNNTVSGGGKREPAVESTGLPMFANVAGETAVTSATKPAAAKPVVTNMTAAPQPVKKPIDEGPAAGSWLERLHAAFNPSEG